MTGYGTINRPMTIPRSIGNPSQLTQLTKLAQQCGSKWGGTISVSASDCWKERIQLDTDKASKLLPEADRKALREWWLAFPQWKGSTPNFGIASTCKVNGKRGLLLIETKAHARQLTVAGKGPPRPSAESQQNHDRIHEAIEEANAALTKQTQLTWALSRDNCYQMSNRFAWSWKLREFGYSVILVYRSPLPYTDWERAVKAHSSPLFPAQQVWNQWMNTRGHTFLPCICSY